MAEGIPRCPVCGAPIRDRTQIGITLEELLAQAESLWSDGQKVVGHLQTLREALARLRMPPEEK